MNINSNTFSPIDQTFQIFMDKCQELLKKKNENLDKQSIQQLINFLSSEQFRKKDVPQEFVKDCYKAIKEKTWVKIEGLRYRTNTIPIELENLFEKVIQKKLHMNSNTINVLKTSVNITKRRCKQTLRHDNNLTDSKKN